MEEPEKQTIKITLYLITQENVQQIVPLITETPIYPKISKRGVKKFSLDIPGQSFFNDIAQKKNIKNGAQAPTDYAEDQYKYQISFKGEGIDANKKYCLSIDKNQFQNAWEQQNPKVNIPQQSIRETESQNNKTTKQSKLKYFFYNEKIYPVQIGKVKTPIVISTDIGGTLVGNQEGLEKFNLLYLKHFYFDKKHTLIYNSGRSLQSYQKAQKQLNLILPDYFISRCGVIIYTNNRGHFEIDQNWSQNVKIDWNYEGLNARINNLKWLKQKQNENDRNLCMKFLCENHIFEQNSEEFYRLEQQLHKEFRFECIVRTKTARKCIDFIPISTNKGQALEYLCKTKNIDMSHTLAFGDTMNDCAMLEKACVGVLVQNSMPDVIKWMESQNKSKQLVNEQLVIKQNITNSNINNNNNIQHKQKQQQQCEENGISINQINKYNKQKQEAVLNIENSAIKLQQDNIQKQQYNLNSLYLSKKDHAQAITEALELIMDRE